MKSPARSNRAAVRYLTAGALIAALYVVLTLLCAAAGLSSSPVQLRLSEGLCALTYLTPAAVPGLWVGCLAANLLTPGSNVWDIFFGSLATLLGALGGRLFAVLSRRAARKGHAGRSRVLRLLVPLPTVAANTVIIPLVLKYAYGFGDALPFFMLTVGIGEVLSAWICGLLLLRLLRGRFGDD